MLSSILEKIPINLGPSFLKAGLIPVLAGWLAFQTSTGGLMKFVDLAIQNIGEGGFEPSAIIYQSLLILGLSVIFAGVGDYIFLFAQRVPINLFSIRKRLLNNELRRKSEIEREMDEWLFKYGISQWPSDGFYEPKIKPLEIGNTIGWISSSSNGRIYLKKVATNWKAPDDLSPTEEDFILNGLLALNYKCYYTPEDLADPKLQTEIMEWKNLLAGNYKNEIKAILEEISVRCQREYNYLRPERENFPERAFAMPTKLGNIIASIDDYGEFIYGIQTSILWSMIKNLLNDSEKESISRLKLSIQMYLNLAITLSISTVFILLMGLVNTFQSVQLFLLLNVEWTWENFLNGKLNFINNSLWEVNFPLIILVIIIPFLLLLNNQLILSYAGQFKEQVIVLINLKKREVQNQFGVKPKSSTVEFEIFKKISDSIMAKKPLKDVSYVDEEEGESEGQNNLVINDIVWSYSSS